MVARLELCGMARALVLDSFPGMSKGCQMYLIIIEYRAFDGLFPKICRCWRIMARVLVVCCVRMK
jgi:hypothetical protein